MPTQHSSNIIGEGITFDLTPDPTGPMTLAERLAQSEFALKIQDRVACGNAFIPPGNRERLSQSIQNERARLELILEEHPEMKQLLAEHTELRTRLHRATAEQSPDVETLQDACAKMAEKIVSIEHSVDLGA